MTMTAAVNLTVTNDLVSALDLKTVESHLVKKMNQAFANGVGLGQATKVFDDTRAVLTGATDSLDLNGGGLLDALGAAFNLTRLVALIIKAASANTTNLTVLGNAAAVPILNTVATTVTLQPGGLFVFLAPSAAGVVVTAATGDIIQVVNAAGATANYDVVIFGS